MPALAVDSVTLQTYRRRCLTQGRPAILPSLGVTESLSHLLLLGICGSPHWCILEQESLHIPACHFRHVCATCKVCGHTGPAGPAGPAQGQQIPTQAQPSISQKTGVEGSSQASPRRRASRGAASMPNQLAVTESSSPEAGR